MPSNRSGANPSEDLILRYRDCSLINWYMEVLDEIYKGYQYQSIRGVFLEGEPVYEGAKIYTKTHIQIAVRDPVCVLGYFRPNIVEGKANE